MLLLQFNIKNYIYFNIYYKLHQQSTHFMTIRWSSSKFFKMLYITGLGKFYPEAVEVPEEVKYASVFSLEHDYLVLTNTHTHTQNLLMQCSDK